MRKKIIIYTSIILVIVIAYFVAINIDWINKQFFTRKCAKAGETIPTPYQNCCHGLTELGNIKEDYSGGCAIGWGGLLACAPCGNGICDTKYGENKCNCKQDCQ